MNLAMAEQRGDAQQSSQSQDPQRLVRDIVADLITDERPSCQENTPVTMQNRFTNVNQEVNSIFRIPRDNSTQVSRSTAENTSSSSNQHHLTSFNPRQNYSRRQEGRQRQQPIRLQQPLRKRQRTSAQSSQANQVYIKSVFLLPSPTWSTVPRREKKVWLQLNIFSIDAFRIDKRWCLEELKSAFSQLFSTVLINNSTPCSEPIGFEFVKSTGTTIVPIHLPNGQELDGQMLKHIAATGPVYLRVLKEVATYKEEQAERPEIKDWFSHIPDDPELDQEDFIEPATSIQEERVINTLKTSDNELTHPTVWLQGQPSTSETTVNKQQFPTCYEEPKTDIPPAHVTEMLETLKQIFVGRSPELLARAAEKHSNIEDAINEILDCALESSSSSSENSDFKEDNMVLASARNSTLALNSYRQQMSASDTQVMTIDRQSPHFLRDVIRIYKKPGFDLKSIPEIEFENEIGIDAGGLTREFFHLVLTHFSRGDPNAGIVLFEGATDHLVPIHCSSSLDSGLFFLFGKVLSHSILHGGPGFIGMAPPVAKYIATRSLDEAASLLCLDDIPDLQYRDYTQKIVDASSEVQFLELCECPTLNIMLDSAGFVREVLCPGNAHMAAQQIMIHEVLNKRMCEMADISNGMESLSLMKLLSMCPDVASVVFPAMASYSIDPGLLKRLMKTNSSNFKGIPENENALKWLNMYIDECANEKRSVTLGDLCMFVRGKPEIAEFSVQFHRDKSKLMPTASTCSSVLTLPVGHKTYDDFKQQMDNALEFESMRFHLV